MALTPKRILVPTDFSPASDNAIDLANRLAGPFEAETHLLHVHNLIDPPIVTPAEGSEAESTLPMSDEQTREALGESATRIDGPSACHLRRGSPPADAIIDAIDKHRCDLVIMGTSGSRGLRGLFVGSVAKAVIQRSPVPVMTTRAETGSASPPEKILVAYETLEDSLDAVRVAAEWASLFSAEVTLLHVMEPAIQPGPYAHSTLSESQVDRFSARFQNVLAEVGREHLGAVAHEIAVIHAQAAPGIANYANEGAFGLVVLATHNRSKIARVLFGSVAERVTQIARTPVLTVRKPPTKSTDAATKTSGRLSKPWNRFTSDPDRPAPIAVERSPDRTVIRFHDRETLAGVDLGLIEGLWAVLEDESCDPKPTIVVIARPGLLGPDNLERLVVGSETDDDLTTATLKSRIIREENVIQRYITTIRSLDSFVIGVAGGDIALHLAAPLLACDYRIISPDTVFVNTTQTLPNAPLGCLPWLLAKMVGGAQSTHLLLDVPRLSADDALALGLVNHVTTSARFEDEAFEVAERIASLPRATLISLKRCLTAANDDLQSYLSLEMRLTEKLSSPHLKSV